MFTTPPQCNTYLVRPNITFCLLLDDHLCIDGWPIGYWWMTYCVLMDDLLYIDGWLIVYIGCKKKSNNITHIISDILASLWRTVTFKYKSMCCNTNAGRNRKLSSGDASCHLLIRPTRLSWSSSVNLILKCVMLSLLKLNQIETY